MEEHDIIEQIRLGDKEHFRHLIKRCNQPLYRTAMAIVKNESDAEDAIQTTYLKAFLRLDSFREDASFLTWITRILINECKMLLRSRRTMASVDAINEEKNNLIMNEESIDARQMRAWIEKEVMTLPEKYRLVYMFREVNEYSTEETAKLLQVSEENVKVRLHRAKSLIRDGLVKRVPMNELFEFGNKRCELLTERVMISLSTVRAEN